MNKQIAYGEIPFDEALKFSGFDFLCAIRDGKLPHPQIAKTLDFQLVIVEKGFVVWEGSPKAEYFNPLGRVHGGWIATLLDSCMGCAGHTMLDAGYPYTTLDLKVNYTRGIMPKVGLLRAEGRVVHSGRTMLSMEGRLVDQAGKIYAHGTSVCLVLEPPGTNK
ncbi:MAG: PaaI family thioesterase [Rhodospirillales bacterium]